jgi:hypothetical protein
MRSRFYWPGYFKMRRRNYNIAISLLSITLCPNSKVAALRERIPWAISLPIGAARFA